MVKGAIAKIVKVLLFTVTALICMFQQDEPKQQQISEINDLNDSSLTHVALTNNAYLFGIAIFAVGIWASLQKQKNVEELLGTGLYTTTTYIFIIVGVSIAFLSSLGCCGAWKEERFKLGLYFLVLLIAFVILLAGAAMGFVFKDKVEDKLHDRMNVTIQDYGKKEPITNAWDAIQVNFKCCGFATNTTGESYKIWEGNEHLKNESLTVPMSCCNNTEKAKECQKDPKNNVHKDDCYLLLKDYFKKNSKIVGAVGLAIALFLVIGMAMTCYVNRALKRTYTQDLMHSEMARH